MTHDAHHEINGVHLTVVMDEARDGTWTASWWYPMPMAPAPVEWSDGNGTGYATREAAEQAAIDWAHAHGPQR